MHDDFELTLSIKPQSYLSLLELFRAAFAGQTEFGHHPANK